MSTSGLHTLGIWKMSQESVSHNLNFTETSNRITCHYTSGSPMNFIMGSQSLCLFQAVQKMLKELGLILSNCFSHLPEDFLYLTLLCLPVCQASTVWVYLGATQHITTGSSHSLICAGLVFLWSALLRLQEKHSILAKRERVKEIQATSHLSHHKKSSSQGYEPSFRGESERVKDESLSGSNNKEMLPYTSFLDLSPSVAVASFKSFKSSPTWPMASDPSS